MNWIEQLKALAKTTTDSSWQAPTNEEATKLVLVVPFIRILGYNVHSLAEVMPEFLVSRLGERVDYAILENKKPIILVEVKTYQTKLDEANRDQLGRYFHATEAPIGILTNGRVFQLFAAVDTTNRMDKKPFAEINLQNLCHATLSQLECITKPKFDLGKLLVNAKKLKDRKSVEDVIRQEFTNPTNWLVREIVRRVYSSRRTNRRNNITSQALDYFRPIVTNAIQSYILDEADKINKDKEHDQKPAEEDTAETEKPMELLKQRICKDCTNVIKEICKSLVNSDRITTYDGRNNHRKFTLDGRQRNKTFLRLYFENKKKVIISIFDEDQPKDVLVTDSSDLHQYQERIRKALKLKL